MLMELGLGKKPYNETEKQSEMEKDAKMTAQNTSQENQVQRGQSAYTLIETVSGVSLLECSVAVKI